MNTQNEHSAVAQQTGGYMSFGVPLPSLIQQSTDKAADKLNILPKQPVIRQECKRNIKSL